MADTIVCSACLTEACWQGVLMCEDARRAGVRFAGAPRRKPMADHPDLTAELDVAEDIVTGRVEAVVTEWGVRSPSGYVTRLGSDEEAGKVARELAEDYGREGSPGALVRRTVTYGPWEESDG